MKNIEPLNDKGEKHGYHEIYNTNGKLSITGWYLNGIPNGLFKYYDGIDNIKLITIYKNGRSIGFRDDYMFDRNIKSFIIL